MNLLETKTLSIEITPFLDFPSLQADREMIYSYGRGRPQGIARALISAHLCRWEFPHRLIPREKYALKMIILDERMRCIAIGRNSSFGHTPLFILKNCRLHDWTCPPLNGSLKGSRSIRHTKCDILYPVAVETYMFSNWTRSFERGSEHNIGLSLLHNNRDMIPHSGFQPKRGNGCKTKDATVEMGCLKCIPDIQFNESEPLKLHFALLYKGT